MTWQELINELLEKYPNILDTFVAVSDGQGILNTDIVELGFKTEHGLFLNC